MEQERIEQLEQRMDKLERGIENLLEHFKIENPNNFKLPISDGGLKGEKAREQYEEVSNILNNQQGLKAFSYFNNGNEESCSTYTCDIESLKHIDPIEAERWINAFASMERIEIITKLLEKRCSGTELMEKIGFSTTGKLYHHLNYLLNIGVVVNENGIYFLAPHMIGSVLLLLSSATFFVNKLKRQKS